MSVEHPDGRATEQQLQAEIRVIPRCDPTFSTKRED